MTEPRKYGPYTAHSAADDWPIGDVKALSAAIVRDGQQVPCLVGDVGGEQLLLDGRTRYLACELAGMTPTITVQRLPNWGAADSVVDSLNRQRRHLTPSQLAIIAVNKLERYKLEAAERQQGSLFAGVRSAADTKKGPATQHAAAAVGAKTRAVEQARRVRQNDPDSLVAVEQGKLTLTQADAIAAAPAERRNELRTAAIEKGMSSREIAKAARKAARNELDFYSTPAKATQVILPYIKAGSRILEPCCGNGSIARVLDAHGCEVITGDIDPRHKPDYEWDFTDEALELPADPGLAERAQGSLAFDWVVTNPPYSDATPFVRRALATGARVALLLRITWLDPADERRDIFKKNPPSGVIILRRFSFTGSGNDFATVAWVLWGVRLKPMLQWNDTKI